MENHWLFVFLLIFLRLTTAEIANVSTPAPGITLSTIEASTRMPNKETFTTSGLSMDEMKSLTITTGVPAETTEEPFPDIALSTDTASDTLDRNAEENAQKTLSSSNEIDAAEDSIPELDSDNMDSELLKADVALEHFLRQVLDQLRLEMKSGMYDGEALDPLKLEDMKLQPLVAGEVFDVTMQNITLTGLSDYRVTQVESHVRETRIKLGLHYPKIIANCMFAANGTMYDIFSVRGAGNATLIYNEVHAWTIVYFTRENGTLQVSSADQPYVDFKSAAITFRDDTKDNKEVNAESVATQLGPLYFWILTASAVEKVDYPLALFLNDAMSKFPLPEVLQKLSFRQKYLRIHVPNNPLPYAYVSPQMK